MKGQRTDQINMPAISRFHYIRFFSTLLFLGLGILFKCHTKEFVISGRCGSTLVSAIFMEIGQILLNEYNIFNNKNTFQVEILLHIWP